MMLELLDRKETSGGPLTMHLQDPAIVELEEHLQAEKGKLQ